MSANRKVSWGVLSTALIGTRKVIPAMQRGEFSSVTAIASRDLGRAQSAAKELGIPKAYGSYEELLADPAIQAIYNPLPNHLHVPWSIKALEAGKHVLCEKPIGLSSSEGQLLVDAGKRFPKLKLMEAFMYRHNPQWVLAKSLVKDGSLGETRTIQTFFSYFNDDPDNIRNIADIGGGGLFDIGCYCISLSRFLFDAEPNRVVGLVEYDPSFGTDRLASGILDFGDRSSSFVCSTQISPHQRVNIVGTKGRVEIEVPFNAPNDQPCLVTIQRGEEKEERRLPICDQYTVQGDLMSRAILEDTAVPTPIEDAVANMKVIEAMLRSGKEGGWVSL